jgi:urease subunit alpha
MADLVLWDPKFFGAKPKMVIKGGLISYSGMGDPNASLPTCQPIIYRPMFGGFGSALPETCVSFVSQLAMDKNVKEKYGLRRQVMPVKNTRAISKSDMIRNSYLPHIEVNPETFAVTVDGVHLTVQALKKIALNQIYFFS